jgi:hypothetical protein
MVDLLRREAVPARLSVDNVQRHHMLRKRGLACREVGLPRTIVTRRGSERGVTGRPYASPAPAPISACLGASGPHVRPSRASHSCAPLPPGSEVTHLEHEGTPHSRSHHMLGVGRVSRDRVYVVLGKFTSSTVSDNPGPHSLRDENCPDARQGSMARASVGETCGQA